MVYFISIFFPFIGLFLIKKPVMGYFSLVAHLLILLGHSLYPTPLIIFLLWIFLVLWTFFEINDYRVKRSVNKITKILSGEKNLATRNSEENEDFLSQNADNSLLDLSMDNDQSSFIPVKSNITNQNLHHAPVEEEFSTPEDNYNSNRLRMNNFDSRFYPASNERLQESNRLYGRNQDIYAPYTRGHLLGREEESYADDNIIYNNSNNSINGQNISSSNIDNSYQSYDGSVIRANQANTIGRDVSTRANNQINSINYGNYKLNSPVMENQMQHRNLQQNGLSHNHKLVRYNQNNFVRGHTGLPPKQNQILPSQGKMVYKNYNKTLEQEALQGNIEKTESFRIGREKAGDVNYNNARVNLLHNPMIRGFVSRESLQKDKPEEVLATDYINNNSYYRYYKSNLTNRR